MKRRGRGRGEEDRSAYVQVRQQLSRAGSLLPPLVLETEFCWTCAVVSLTYCVILSAILSCFFEAESHIAQAGFKLNYAYVHLRPCFLFLK